MTAITSLGFELTRLDQRIEELNAAFRSIYGADINIEPNTPDGQVIGIFAEAINKVDLLALYVYQQLDPSTAKDVGLARLVLLNGLRRLDGASTQVTLLITGTPGAFVPAGSLFKSALNTSTFSTVSDAVLGSGGSVTVVALCTKKGAITAPANSITEKVSILYGVTAVTNPTGGLIGRVEETDEELRLRQTKSTATPGQAIFDSIQGYLSNLEGVSQCRVYENRDGTVDENGQAPHSIHVVIIGGVEELIVSSIWKKISNGCTLIGTTEVTYLDSKGNPQLVRYSRPLELLVYVKIQVKLKKGFPANGVDLLKENLVNWAYTNQLIGEDVIQSRLYDPLNEVPGHSVTSLTLGFTPSPMDEDDLPVLYAEIATFDLSRIEVEILP